MDTKELEALNLLHYSPVDVNEGVLGPLFPVVLDQLLCLADVEGEVAVLAATQSRVNMEYWRGLVILPTLTTWGRPVKKSRIQLHKAGLRPRTASLMLSLEDTMVWKAEL